MKKIVVSILYIGFIFIIGCGMEDDSTEASLYTYHFTGRVVELDGIAIDRTQPMDIEIFEYCALGCKKDLIEQNFATTSDGHYSFEVESEVSLEGYLYTINPVDGSNFYTKVEERAAIGRQLKRSNQDEIIIAVASLVELTIKSKNPISITLNNCPDLVISRLGCNPSSFWFDEQVDTIMTFRYPYELTPHLNVRWQSFAAIDNQENSKRIELAGNFIHRYHINP
jgi:hypothetical protein